MDEIGSANEGAYGGGSELDPFPELADLGMNGFTLRW